jgi:hypothetical protein
MSLCYHRQLIIAACRQFETVKNVRPRASTWSTLPKTMISSLPNEVLANAFSFLDQRRHTIVSRVSHQFQRVIRDYDVPGEVFVAQQCVGNQRAIIRYVSDQYFNVMMSNFNQEEYIRNITRENINQKHIQANISIYEDLDPKLVEMNYLGWLKSASVINFKFIRDEKWIDYLVQINAPFAVQKIFFVIDQYGTKNWTHISKLVQSSPNCRHIGFTIDRLKISREKALNGFVEFFLHDIPDTINTLEIYFETNDYAGSIDSGARISNPQFVRAFIDFVTRHKNLRNISILSWPLNVNEMRQVMECVMTRVKHVTGLKFMSRYRDPLQTISTSSEFFNIVSFLPKSHLKRIKIVGKFAPRNEQATEMFARAICRSRSLMSIDFYDSVLKTYVVNSQKLYKMIERAAMNPFKMRNLRQVEIDTLLVWKMMNKKPSHIRSLFE